MGIVTVDTGAVCMPVPKAVDNGGATYQGVTKDSVKVVAIMPNAQQLAALGSRSLPPNYGTGQPGKVRTRCSTGWPRYEHVFGGLHVGRKIELEFVTSSGDDEAAQRADAVAVLDKKPFLVLDLAQSLQAFDVAGRERQGAGVLPVRRHRRDAEAGAVPVGHLDNAAASINGAEFVAKQVAGKKAEFAGDASMHDKTRKLGLVK